uniref:Metallophos domain-containing protein n=1 Tax=Loa loa TaxID=7209 RepID=A0A1I7V786_LOALO
MSLHITRLAVIISSITAAVSIIFLNIFGSRIFGVDDVHDYRKGNRARQLSTIKFEFFIFPFSIFTYLRLIEFAKYILTYNSNGLMTYRARKNVSLNVKDLPDSANGIRFAFISDIHAGAMVFTEQVEKLVNRVNSEAVDAVFIVGDVVDAPRDSMEYRVKPLQLLKPKTFYVSGNHEYYYGNASEWFDLFQQYGFEVLNNRHVIFRGICVAGVSDYSSGLSGLPGHMFHPVEALKGCPQNSTTIMLSHNPASAKEIAFNDAHLRVDLILSGHTHAGQFYTIAPIAYLIMSYYYGLYQISPKTQLFVTAGTFYQGAPMKMVWTSEIWIIELHAVS